MPSKILVLLVVVLLGISLGFSTNAIAQETVLALPDSSVKKQTEQQWVDSVFNSLSENQRLGQLFMVAAFSNKTAKHAEEIEALVRNQHIGGLIFFQGGPLRQAQLTNRYQAVSKVPLFIAMDGEWGVGMRLDKDSSISFPKQMTLGAIQDNQQVYQMGKEIARQFKRLGMHINFAPVVDVNSNPKNPVIGMRSFGEQKENVAAKGIAYMKGMQDQRVLACAKHFPGHGDTDADSHLSMPVIKHTKEQHTQIDLYPFQKLIADSVASIMVAHLHVPAFDDEANKPTTLSTKVVTDLLKKEMGFKGLIFTDALNMKGVSKFYKPGEVDVMALIAGNDIMLYSEDVALAIQKTNEAIKSGKLSREDLDNRVKKVLHAKYWAGLHEYKPIQLTNLVADLNSTKAKAVQLESYAKAITLLKNNQKLIPIKYIDTTSFACVSIGLEQGNKFQQMVSNYVNCQHFNIDKNAPNTKQDSLLKVLKNYEIVLVGLHGTNPFNNKDYGISENTRTFINQLQAQNKVILTVFGNPYGMKYFGRSQTLLCAYEDNAVTQEIVPQIIFGGREVTGKLPITASSEFPLQMGISTANSVLRVRRGYPENARMDNNILLKIDTLIRNEINQRTMPGCQVLVARDGQIVYDKCFGNLVYDTVQPVTPQTLYDIASITKVAGTLQAVMFLEERGLIDIDRKVAHYLPELENTNKEDIVIRDVLTHQAGLIPFMAHWKNTLDSSGFMAKYYRTTRNDTFNLEVIPGLYALSTMEDTLWKWSIASEMQKKKTRKQKEYEYAYSDLGFYIMKRIVEKIVHQPIDEFMQQNFYEPLYLRTLCYKPLNRFPAEHIAPTEDDKLFRKHQLRGSVHDQGAALLGGVGGHAGIFSNATDLAILAHMNLNKGYYGGRRYLLPGTVERFAERQFPKNRRGLGWDKPERFGGGPTSRYASPETFGHTGYTGTCVWIDPKYNLVFIFLSNRGYPDDSNKKLIKHNTRTRIQDLIYKSMINYQD